MKQKRKVLILFLVVVLILVSGILMINKNSFADIEIEENNCPNEIRDIYVDSEVLDYIKTDKNRIEIPKQMIGVLSSLEPASLDSEISNVGQTFSTSGSLLFSKEKEDDIWINEIVQWRPFKLRTTSYEMGYLLNQANFSSKEEENNYYKQILILWAMDRLQGYEDNYNYQRDNYGEMITSQPETTYDEKFEQPNDYKINWKYFNNLSAGDKNMLKDSPIGQQMETILADWMNYINWMATGNFKVELNSINPEDLSYYATNDYIETQLITPTSKDTAYAKLLSNYEVTVTSPMTVVDSEGKERTTFSANEGFKLRIPISEIKDKTMNYNVDIKGYYLFPIANVYEIPEPSREIIDDYKDYLISDLSRSIIPDNCISKATLIANTSLNFSKEVGNLNIKVIDASTGDNLSKAEITVYNSKGLEVYRYETTDKEVDITLPVGNYTVKQTITPPYYQAKVVEQKVEVTKDNTVQAILESVPLVEVPNTSKKATNMLIFGAIIMMLGLVAVGVAVKIKPINKK